MAKQQDSIIKKNAGRAEEALDIKNTLTKRKFGSDLPLSKTGDQVMKDTRVLAEDDPEDMGDAWGGENTSGFQTGTPGGDRPMIGVLSKSAWNEKAANDLGPVNTDSPGFKRMRERSRQETFNEEFSHINWEFLDNEQRGLIAKQFHKKAKRDPNFRRFVFDTLKNSVSKNSPYVWAEDVSNYLEDKKTSKDLNLKEIYENINEKGARIDFLDELRAKTSNYALYGPKRANGDIMDAYPEFKRQNDKNKVLKNKVKKNGKRR